MEFEGDGAPRMDFVFTVCDNAAGETCPVWPGQPMTAHWGIEDPAAVEGSDLEKHRAFNRGVPLHAQPDRGVHGAAARQRSTAICVAVTTSAEDRRHGRFQHKPTESPVTMSIFERYLTVWVGLCIVVGIALGQLMPGLFQAIGAAEIAKVNLPVAVLIWLMIIPMLVKIDFAALRQVKEHWRGIGVTLFINWAVKPFSMALLGWLFIGWLFRPYLPADQIDSYIAGLILLAAAPCTAMVFVWSNLSDGEPHFTLSQVALNDVIMVFAFAPIVGLLLGLSAITVPWETLLLSVVLYIVVPVIIAQVMRRCVLARGGEPALARAARAVCSRCRSSRCWRRWSCCSASRASRSWRSR